MMLLFLGIRICIRIRIIQLLFLSACYYDYYPLSQMRYWAFWSPLGHILDDFKIVWTCVSIFLSPNVLGEIHIYFTFELINNKENTIYMLYIKW
jgi:hypothetical protein